MKLNKSSWLYRYYRFTYTFFGEVPPWTLTPDGFIFRLLVFGLILVPLFFILDKVQTVLMIFGGLGFCLALVALILFEIGFVFYRYPLPAGCLAIGALGCLALRRFIGSKLGGPCMVWIQMKREGAFGRIEVTD